LTAPTKYHVYDFLSFVLDYFPVAGCPLCQKHHTVKFYILVNRGFRISEEQCATIKVVRIICEYNLKQRKETKELLQYTMTVLPSSLIPHSRIPVHVIFNTVTNYMNGAIANQYRAALLIFCSSRHSFRLYYMRIIARHTDWYAFFSGIREEPLIGPETESWAQVISLMKEYARPLHTEWWESYAHAVLCLNGMGLGP
jgi:hypothetical protein